MKNISKVTDNSDKKRYEMVLEGKTAYVEYILNTKGMIFLTHTEVPKKFEGRGIAFEMIRQILEDIEQRQLKLIPLCPVVAAFIRRHPEWKRLLMENIHV